MSSHEHQPLPPSNPSWVWSGVHGASGIVHPFLAIRDDPDRLYSHPTVSFNNVNYIVHYNSILAGSGGLLLINQSPENDPFGEEVSQLLHRLGVVMGRSTEFGEEFHAYTTVEAHQVQSSMELDQGWESLMVVNPSTQESRVLPPANSLEIDLQFWSYEGAQANLLVDTDSQTYTVTLTFPYCVCLYSSTSNAWQCWRFNPRFSWGHLNRELVADPWRVQVANAYVDGRLFFADVVLEDLIPTMTLMEIDVEAGSWKLHNWRYSLQTQFTEFVDTPFLRMRGLTERGMRHQALHTRTVASRGRGRGLGNFQIVECMGELYAVIPTSLSEYLPMSLRSRRTLAEVVHEYANSGLSFMPLQFLIVNMRGDGFVHGVLRIVVPEDVSSVVGGETGNDYEDRKTGLMNILAREPFDEVRLLFSCVAEGSVIWVALMDYVLQYDVVTGVSKTEIIHEEDEPEESLQFLGNRVPYRPSNMKP